MPSRETGDIPCFWVRLRNMGFTWGSVQLAEHLVSPYPACSLTSDIHRWYLNFPLYHQHAMRATHGSKNWVVTQAYLRWTSYSWLQSLYLPSRRVKLPTHPMKSSYISQYIYNPNPATPDPVCNNCILKTRFAR